MSSFQRMLRSVSSPPLTALAPLSMVAAESLPGSALRGIALRATSLRQEGFSAAKLLAACVSHSRADGDSASAAGEARGCRMALLSGRRESRSRRGAAVVGASSAPPQLRDGRRKVGRGTRKWASVRQVGSALVSREAVRFGSAGPGRLRSSRARANGVRGSAATSKCARGSVRLRVRRPRLELEGEAVTGGVEVASGWRWAGMVGSLRGGLHVRGGWDQIHALLARWPVCRNAVAFASVRAGGARSSGQCAQRRAHALWQVCSSASAPVSGCARPAARRRRRLASGARRHGYKGEQGRERAHPPYNGSPPFTAPCLTSKALPGCGAGEGAEKAHVAPLELLLGAPASPGADCFCKLTQAPIALVGWRRPATLWRDWRSASHSLLVAAGRAGRGN